MLRTAAILVAAVAALGAAPHSAKAQQNFTCESYSGRQQVCRVDTSGGVRLVRQLSDTRCVQGRTWGVARNAVWVSGGCRAEFQAGTNYGYNRNNNGYNNNRRYSRRNTGVGRYNRTPGTGNAVQNGARLCQDAASQRYGIKRSSITAYLDNDGSAYARYTWSGAGRSGACYFDANGNLSVRMY
jgi:hypothetical protein